jgi:uncharacterized protein (DUF1697 family)
MRYIAFLRAINITGRFVTMDALRQQFEALGLEDVRTHIQSGNVLFESPEADAATLEARIETQLHEALGFAVATFLRTPQDVLATARHRPFAEAAGEDATLYVAFLRAEPDEERARALLACASDIDALHLHAREVFWLWRRGLGPSAVSGAKIERVVRGPATVRNATVVRKLAEKHLSGA